MNEAITAKNRAKRKAHGVGQMTLAARPLSVPRAPSVTFYLVKAGWLATLTALFYHPYVSSDPSSTSESGARRVLLGELLVQAKVITPEQLTEILGAPREPGKKLGQMLIERGWITEAQLTQTLSLQLSVPWVSLYHIDFSRQLLNRVARELAEQYCLIPIFVRHVKGQGETLYVAMDDPTNENALSEVSRQANLPARPMIASASDIRSAIRVYYGDPVQTHPEVPVPPTREAPLTTREGKGVVQQMQREAAAAATQPEPHAEPRHPSQPPRSPSKPPPPVPVKRPSMDDADGPMTRRSSPPEAMEIPPSSPIAARRASRPDPAERRSTPDAQEAGEHKEEPRRGRPRMVSLTLLDGTTIKLPAKKGEGAAGLTARDFVSALRAHAHGADATEILGDQPRWEPVVAALLSILLRKGLIADWEFVEELRKM